MSKFKPKRFGNELDRMLEHIPGPSFASEDTIGSHFSKIQAEKEKSIHKLFEYFNIQKTDKQRWQKLARKLAEQTVPAMNFKKKTGRTTKWDWLAQLRLYALVQTMQNRQDRSQELPYESLFNTNFVEASKATALKPLVRSISPKRLHNIYLEFLKSPDFHVIEKILNQLDDASRQCFYSDLLEGRI